MTAVVVSLAFFAWIVWQPAIRDGVKSLGATRIQHSRSLVDNAEAHPDEGHSDHDHAANAPSEGEDQVARAGELTARSQKHDHADGKVDGVQDHGGAAEEDQEHGEQESELSPERLRSLGIEVAIAGDGPISLELERPAEVKFDSDRVVHIVPRVAGVVSQVDVSQGQGVERDQLLAVIQSRELAELKSTYLADLERLSLARDNFEREKRLWEKRISSEKDYLAEKSALAEATIAVTASAQKLRALGFSQQYIDRLKDSDSVALTGYEMRAPIAGTIIERHLSLGEAVSTEKEVFMIAETSSVWVDITVYPEDLPTISPGQRVRVDIGNGDVVKGKIAFVTANVHEETRTAVARLIVDSAGGRLKPGMFVKARIEVGEETEGIRIPKVAIQSFNNSPVVFVQEGEKFEPRPVKLGRENSEYVQVLSGVSEGESYVARGSFTLKALIQKSQIGEGHAH
jgi:cobalt-zinc-cadmium efflux system membrane fusion protein